jgi:predicted unusual protein kinase regulating ubiquinone biosynthesis (AarF/ABC1/UbiB family)
MFTLTRLFQIVVVSSRRLSPVFFSALLRFVTLGLVPDLPRPDLPRALRQMLEELGGAFIKYGQILAMRPDLIAREYVLEFSLLLDAVPSFPADEAERIVEQELGVGLKDVFRSFDREPIAAASFAQVHRAVLATGEAVVVKIQRPGLRRVASADIGLVMLAAHVVDFLGLMKRVVLVPVAEEFRDWTEEELDLRVEATYAQRLRDASQKDPDSYIPLVYWKYTTRRIMTMEYLDGVWMSEVLGRIDADGLEKATQSLAHRDIDLDRVASNVINNQLRQVFEHRLFHADPHAGNLVVLENNVIGYVDFGITGELDSEFRATQLMLYDALQRRDNSQYMRAIYRIMKPPPDNIDLDGFEREIKRNAAAWRNALHNPCATLQERSSSWLFTRNLKVTREYGLEVSQMALRYYRALSVVELIVLRLSPEFDFVRALAIYLRQLQLRELAREVKLEAQMQQMLSNRRLFYDGITELRKMLNTTDRNEGVPRRHVSQWRLAASAVVRVMAVVAAIGIVALPLGSLWYPPATAVLLRLGTARTCLLLFAVSIFCAWLAQRLYMSSTQHSAVLAGYTRVR